MNSYERIYENLINVDEQAKKKKSNSKLGRFIGPLSLEYELIGRRMGLPGPVGYPKKKKRR